ncbi:MAG TPA: hypothetical protein VKD23_01905 [Terriglobales bacterium]|nr:hypothetical protein [Terriglobales bacterium]
MADPTITSPKRSPFTLGWIALVVLSVIISHFVANYEQFLPYHWRTYTAPDGSFSVQFPDKPSVVPTQVPFGSGGTTTIDFITANPTTHTAYSCFYFDQESIVGKSPNEVLGAARDGSLRKVQGTLLTEKRIEVEGYPALDTQASARGNSLFDSRIIVAGKRIYMITAIATAKEDREAKTVKRVMDSFKILRKQ